MADMEPEVKGSAGSKTGMIALATALIGAATTISVAYINRSTPAAEVRPAPAQPQTDGQSQGQSQPAPNPVEVDVPSVQPQPLMQTTRNVAGLWTASDGEQMEISQTGAQIVVTGAGMSENGVVVMQGFGRIEDRKLSWTAQVAANGGQAEMDCTGRLTSNGNSIQGVCDAFGQQHAFQFSR
jgi:hypothetical protein